MWALAAFYGSRAYNDTGLLAIAEGIWNSVQAYVVTADDAATGKQPSKNVTFPVHCIANSDGAWYQMMILRLFRFAEMRLISLQHRCSLLGEHCVALCLHISS